MLSEAANRYIEKKALAQLAYYQRLEEAQEKRRSTTLVASVPIGLKLVVWEKAESEDCHISWIVCEALFSYFNIDALDFYGGMVKPKTKTERRQLSEKLSRSWEDYSSRIVKLQTGIAIMKNLGTEPMTIAELAIRSGKSERTVRVVVKDLLKSPMFGSERVGRGGKLYVWRTDHPVEPVPELTMPDHPDGKEIKEIPPQNLRW